MAGHMSAIRMDCKSGTKVIRAEVLKLEHALESPEGLVETQIPGLHPSTLILCALGSEAQDFAFLTSFQVMLLLPDQGPHVENHWVRA